MVSNFARGSRPMLRMPTPQGLKVMEFLEANPGATVHQVNKTLSHAGNVGAWWAYYRNVVRPMGGLDAWKRKRGLR